jgi:predicted enzyme related to lactoylglutathione lyase
MEAAVAFYRDVLGLQMRMRAGEDWAEFEVGGATLALHGIRERPPIQAGATVVFEVEDLDQVLGELRARDVLIEGEINDVAHFGRFVSFRDPDGNILQIFERYPGGPPSA